MYTYIIKMSFSFCYLLTHKICSSYYNSFTHTLIHPLTHSPIYPLTHSFALCYSKRSKYPSTITLPDLDSSNVYLEKDPTSFTSSQAAKESELEDFSVPSLDQSKYFIWLCEEERISEWVSDSVRLSVC